MAAIRKRTTEVSRRPIRGHRLLAGLAIVALALGGSPTDVLAEGATCIGESCDATYVAVTTTGTANSSAGVAVSGTGSANGGAAAATGTGNANSEVVGSISVLGHGETGEGVVAFGGQNEIDNVNVCSITFCDDAFDDAAGQWYAVTALAGVPLPFPADLSICTGVCGQNHYQNDCPEIRDGTGPWRIMEDGWFDINGCPIVLRYGVHRSDHEGWGWIHIQNKPRDWDWSDYTRNLTQQTLGHGARVLVDTAYVLHCLNYKTSGGRKRTWHVFVDYKGARGITTVFYRTGHNQCRSS